MELITTIPQKRQIDILDFFSQHKSFWLPIDYVCQKLDTKPTTFKQDVSSLESYGASFNYNKEKVCFDTVTSKSFEAIYREIFNNITALDIIEEIFFTPNLSSQDLAQRLNISTSTLYRHVNNLNSSLLKKFNIQIESKPYQFVGDEIEIRHFLCEYFAEKYAVFEWPFSSSKLEKLAEEVILSFGKLFASQDKEVPYTLNFPYMYFIKTVLAISVTRTVQGYTIPNTFIYYSQVKKITSNKEIIELSQKFIKRFCQLSGAELDPDIDVLGQLFSVFFQQEFYFDLNHFLEDAKYNPYTKKSITILKEMIQRISDEYDLIIDDIDQLCFYTHNANHINNTRLFVQPILYDRKSLMINEQKAVDGRLVNLIHTLLLDYRHQMGLENNPQLDNYLVYSFISHWESLNKQMCSRRQTYKILVCSIYDSFNAHSQAQIIKNLFPAQADVYINEDRNLTYDKLVESDYDIIVSNFDIKPIPGKKIITAYSPNNLLSLQEVFMNLSQEEQLANDQLQ